MCGIIGEASRSKIKDSSWIKKGMQNMFHRGPDGDGFFISEDQKVAFGHRRLSIFDLSENGKQPMSTIDRKLWITFNGEIYNFKALKRELAMLGVSFKSESDTEVILYAYKLWGDNFVNRIKGQFAFVIYDVLKNRVLLARDISGEKPLFYFKSNESISFSSEMKGLFENKLLERKIDKSSLHYFLQNGYVPSPKSIIENVKKLSPGNYLTINLNNMESKLIPFWDIPDFETNDLTADELVDEIHELLSASVDMQLEADVPVGVLLSGGVDSSIVTAIGANLRSKIKTYTVIFPNDPGYNEQVYSKEISEFFSTEHTELEVDVNSIDIVEDLAFQFDEPMIDSSMIPTYMLSKEIKKFCTVALGGDGGDELFGGYHHHARFEFLKSNFEKYPQFLRNIFAAGANKFLPLGFKGRNWALSLGTNFSKSIPHNNIFFDDNDIESLIGREMSTFNSKIIRENLINKNYEDIVQRSTRYDFKNYMCEDILVKVDRSSMLNSLEMRSPFLDKDVIEYAFKYVPSWMKATSKDRKIILRMLSDKLLPKNFDSSRKQGFSIPLKEWLKTREWKSLINSYLLDESSIFNHNQVKKIIKYQDFGLSNSERIFGLLIFEIWRKKYKVTL